MDTSLRTTALPTYAHRLQNRVASKIAVVFTSVCCLLLLNAQAVPEVNVLEGPDGGTIITSENNMVAGENMYKPDHGEAADGKARETKSRPTANKKPEQVEKADTESPKTQAYAHKQTSRAAGYKGSAWQMKEGCTAGNWHESNRD